MILRRADGTIGAMCHHNGCHGKGWKDLRVIYEPDAGQRKRPPEMVILHEDEEAGATGQRSAQLLAVPGVDQAFVFKSLPVFSAGQAYGLGQ